MHIPSDTFNIDQIMRLNQLQDTNFAVSGTWGDKKIPWKVWLHEPTDTLKPTAMLLSMGSKIYPLSQSATWIESEGGEFGSCWSQSKSGWRIRTADGRWVPSLQDLGADLIIDD
jgi:hypothetical protein